MAARALTANELFLLRQKQQSCLLYLAVLTPAIVCKARVASTPTSNDRIAQLTYHQADLGWSNTLADQTVYVGTLDGSYDVGMARLRAPLTGQSGTMKIAETSDVQFAADQYITIVNEFAPWPRHIRIDDEGKIYMDHDVAYSDQHTVCAPVPVLGPPSVVWLTGATVTVSFDASRSWVIGSTIASYSWDAPGASSTSGMNTATPTIVYDTTGTFRVSCTVTAASGGTFTGYRWVFVYSDEYPPTTAFVLESCDGDRSNGGWTARITAYDEATRDEIRDRAMVVVFARDVYGSTAKSIGPISGRENIVFVGWVAGETINYDTESGSVTFEVYGLNYWLAQMMGFPSGIEDVSDVPDSWAEFSDLTVDRGLWHFLHWRTTLTRFTDCFLTGDTRQIRVFDAPIGTLWEQITRVARETILATACCDRYGALYVEIDTQLLPVASRGDIPVVMELTDDDWENAMEIRRETVSDVAMVDLSGVAYQDGEAQALFSLALGHIPARYGNIRRYDRLALSSQAQSNALAGLVFADEANLYPLFDIRLASNNRAFDIAPNQYVALTIEGSDTVRGITLPDARLIPRRVSLKHNANDGVLLASIGCELETTGEGLGIDGDPPPEPPPPTSIPPPPPPPDPPAPIIEPKVGAFIINRNQIAVTYALDTETPVWYNADPNNDMLGDVTTRRFHSMDVWNNKAYVTTWDTAASPDLDTIGLWCCDDVSAIQNWTSGKVWKLLVSSSNASAVSNAYQFGAVLIDRETYQVCAPLHGNIMFESEQSGAYIISGSSVNFCLFAHRNNNPSEKPFRVPDSLNWNCVARVGGVWKVGGQVEATPPRSAYQVGDGSGSFSFVLLANSTYPQGMISTVPGISDQYVLNNKDWDSEIFRWGNLDTPWDDGIIGNYGFSVASDGETYLTLRADYDLYLAQSKATAVEIGTAESATSGFGDTGALGALGVFYPKDDRYVAWVRGSSRASITGKRIVIVCDLEEMTWSDKTGNLGSVFTDWSGFTNNSVGNTHIRTFLV